MSCCDRNPGPDMSAGRDAAGLLAPSVWNDSETSSGREGVGFVNINEALLTTLALDNKAVVFAVGETETRLVNEKEPGSWPRGPELFQKRVEPAHPTPWLAGVCRRDGPSDGLDSVKFTPETWSPGLGAKVKFNQAPPPGTTTVVSLTVKAASG